MWFAADHQSLQGQLPLRVTARATSRDPISRHPTKTIPQQRNPGTRWQPALAIIARAGSLLRSACLHRVRISPSASRPIRDFVAEFLDLSFAHCRLFIFHHSFRCVVIIHRLGRRVRGRLLQSDIWVPILLRSAGDFSGVKMLFHCVGKFAIRLIKHRKLAEGAQKGTP